jgi:hypothetical protein
MRADSTLLSPPLLLLRSGSTTGLRHLQGAARGRAAPAPQSQKNLQWQQADSHQGKLCKGSNVYSPKKALPSSAEQANE